VNSEAAEANVSTREPDQRLIYASDTIGLRMTNTGKPYESLTKKVFEAIIQQGDAKNVQVQHDVTLQGRTLAHQIDVFWEFEVGGLRYQTVVQCKDWRSPVKQEQLLAFAGVLDDLPGQPRGVFVTRHGYQKGALVFAKAKGIDLYELREPQDADWDGFIRSVQVTGELLVPKVHDLHFLRDSEWIAGEEARRGAAFPAEAMTIRGVASEIEIQREDGSSLTSAGDVLEQMLSDVQRSPVPREHLFEEAVYVKTTDADWPRVRIRGLRATLEMVVGMTVQNEIRFDSLVHFILKEVRSGSWTPITATGHLLPPDARKPPRVKPVEAPSPSGTSGEKKKGRKRKR
jgi:hypothetical protein